jgi:hypothetical protein
MTQGRLGLRQEGIDDLLQEGAAGIDGLEIGQRLQRHDRLVVRLLEARMAGDLGDRGAGAAALVSSSMTSSSGRLDGLGDIGIHPRLLALPAGLHGGVGGQRHDGQMRIGRWAAR